jgi:hypothetical protein
LDDTFSLLFLSGECAAALGIGQVSCDEQRSPLSGRLKIVAENYRPLCYGAPIQGEAMRPPFFDN